MHFEQVQRFNLRIKYFGVRSTWIKDPYKILTSFLQDSYETFQDLTMILPRFYQHFSRSYKIYQDFTDILQDFTKIFLRSYDLIIMALNSSYKI